MHIAIKPLLHPLDAPRGPALWIRVTLFGRSGPRRITRWGRSWILPLPAIARRLGDRHTPKGMSHPEGGPQTSLRNTTGSRSMAENPVGAFLFLVAVVMLAWLWLVMVTP